MSSSDAQYVNYPDNTVSLRQISHSVAEPSPLGEEVAIGEHVGMRIPELIQRLAVVAVPVGVPVQASDVAFDLNRASCNRVLDPGPLVADLRNRSQAAVGPSDLPVPSDSAVFQVREAGIDRRYCGVCDDVRAEEHPRAQVNIYLGFPRDALIRIENDQAGAFRKGERIVGAGASGITPWATTIAYGGAEPPNSIVAVYPGCDLSRYVGYVCEELTVRVPTRLSGGLEWERRGRSYYIRPDGAVLAEPHVICGDGWRRRNLAPDKHGAQQLRAGRHASQPDDSSPGVPGCDASHRVIYPALYRKGDILERNGDRTRGGGPCGLLLPRPALDLISIEVQIRVRIDLCFGRGRRVEAVAFGLLQGGFSGDRRPGRTVLLRFDRTVPDQNRRDNCQDD